MSKRQLYRITLPHTCFGVETMEGIVVDSAPIWRFCIGWRLSKLKDYIEKKHGILEMVTPSRGIPSQGEKLVTKQPLSMLSPKGESEALPA